MGFRDWVETAKQGGEFGLKALGQEINHLVGEVFQSAFTGKRVESGPGLNERAKKIAEETAQKRMSIGLRSFTESLKALKNGDAESAEKLAKVAESAFRSVETNPYADKYEREFAKAMKEYIQKQYPKDVRESGKSEVSMPKETIGGARRLPAGEKQREITSEERKALPDYHKQDQIKEQYDRIKESFRNVVQSKDPAEITKNIKEFTEAKKEMVKLTGNNEMVKQAMSEVTREFVRTASTKQAGGSVDKESVERIKESMKNLKDSLKEYLKDYTKNYDYSKGNSVKEGVSNPNNVTNQSSNTQGKGFNQETGKAFTR